VSSGEAKQGGGQQEQERTGVLFSNAAAVRAVASAVEGTLGPKGLNCMLVDRFGDVTITNDGSTILEKIEATHPAARLVIRAAKAQEAQVGDGTTTATILASALVVEGASHAAKGVPIAKIVEGMRAAVKRAAQVMGDGAKRVSGLSDPLVLRAAIIAARQQEEIAALALEAAKVFGASELKRPGMRLADWVVAKEGARDEVVSGLVLERAPLNAQMPKDMRDCKILVIDDALEPEKLDGNALATEAGLSRHLELENAFRKTLERIVSLGVGAIFVQGPVSDAAEETLTEAGVMVVRRVTATELARIVEHAGARPVKRTGLAREDEQLRALLGQAARVYEEPELEQIRILRGSGKRLATLMVGASAREVKDERKRIAQDACSAIQQALIGGVLPGGGAAELVAAREAQKVREGLSGMAAYGAECVVEALKAPMAQIVANAGFNPLEKVQQAMAAGGRDGVGIDCETGEVVDMMEKGIVDPATVKVHALLAAAEVAEAILRINTIIRKKEERTGQTP